MKKRRDKGPRIKTILQGSVLAAALLLTACSYSDFDRTTEDLSLSQPTSMTCIAISDFANQAEKELWRVVNDNVMGGKSLGGFTIDESSSRLIFRGFINTDGGGFASIRRSVDLQDRLTPKSVKLRVRTKDTAGEYRLMAYSGLKRSVNHRITLPLLDSTEWQEISISLADMIPSRFGRVLNEPALITSNIEALGLMRRSTIDGEFELQVDWIKICT